jgi:TP901 family phage tail tape measure protein
VADDSRNPLDRSEMRRLEGDLRGVLGELRQDLAESRQLRGQAAEEQRRTETRARAESKARRSRLGDVPPAEEPAAVESSANQAERLAQARERAARAARASEESTRSEARIVQAQRLALPRAGGTTGGYQGGLTSAEVRARAEQANLQTGGPRGPGGPPRPRPVAAAGDDGQARNLRSIIDGYRRAAAAGQGLATEESDVALRARGIAQEHQRLEASLQQSTRAIGLSSNAMQRHGYLTSEFINAARRGQVTFRELGEQVGGTIGKFAGWTGAAAAVYGALGAVSALGRGAIDSNRGVNQLSRVITSGFDTDAAQQKFRELAHEMNLPIGQVADAAYGMSKVFNNQTDALDATRQALFAVKVGELDAATATRYLTSIVAGFGLDAAQLPAVFDAINNAQNRFGGNVGQITAGVAKAAGSFRLAGGNYQQLISLIVAGTRLTGTSGENVGTAISRSASNVLTAAGQKRLEAAGLDPSKEYPQLLGQAFKEAHGASRTRVEEIARALVPAGGQFARVFVPLLENVKLYNKVMKATDPEQAKGSSVRELHKTLHSFSEQLSAVVNNLEQLGSGLAQAGALDVLGGAVFLLNQMLHASTEILDQFNQLPAPLRHALVIMAEIYGLTRLLRRFDVGASIPVGERGQLSGIAGALRRPPAQLEHAQVLRGLNDEQKFLGDARERTAQQAGLANYQALRSAQRHADLLSSGTATEQEIERSARQVVQREEEAARLKADQVDLADRQAVVQRQQKALAQQHFRTQQEVRDAAQRQGVYYAPPTLERQAPVQPSHLGDDPNATFISPQGTAAQTRYMEGQKAIQKAGQQVRGFANRAGVTGRITGGVLQVAGTSTLVAARGIGSLGKGLFGFARSIAASLGPLDILLLGIGTFLAVKSHVEGRLNESSATIDRLSSTAGGAGAIHARAQKVRDHTSFGDKLTNAYADYHNFFADNLPGGLGGGHLNTPDRVEKDAAKAADAFAATIDRVQKKGVELYLTQISGNLKRRLAGAGGNKGKQAAYDRALNELAHSYARSFGGPEALRAADELKHNFIAGLTDLKAVGGTLTSVMDAITNEPELAGFVQHLQNRVALQGPTQANVRRAGAAAARARELAARESDPKAAAKFLQDAQDAENAILQPAEQRLNYLLAAATTPHATAVARHAYIGQVRQALGIDAQHARVKQLQDNLHKRSGEIAKLEKEQAITGVGVPDLIPLDKLRKGVGGLEQFGQLGIPNLADPHSTANIVGPEEAKKSQKLKKLRAKQLADQRALRALRKEMGVTDEQFKAIVLEQRKAQAAAELQSFDTKTTLLQSQTADPVAQANILARRLDEKIKIVRENIARHLATIDDLNQVVAQRNQALQQAAQARVANFQSTQQLNASRFAAGTTNQGAILQHNLADAKRFAAYVRSQGSKLDPNTYRQALQTVYDSQKAISDYVRQQAEAMISARAELALAQTDDPVKQARIRAHEADRLIKYASDPADKIKRQAAALRAHRDVRAARAQSRFDTIEFQRDIGQITAQTEYDLLASLLKTHHLTQEFRRNVRRRMHAIKQEMNSDTNGFDLNVGNIKLPTVYEIRRAMKGGAGPSRHQVQVQNNNKITLTVADGADVDEVFSRIDDITGGSLQAAGRAAGIY